MIRARADVEVAGGDRAQRAWWVEAVGLGVVGVVEEVGRRSRRGRSRRRPRASGGARRAGRGRRRPRARRTRARSWSTASGGRCGSTAFSDRGAGRRRASRRALGREDRGPRTSRARVPVAPMARTARAPRRLVAGPVGCERAPVVDFDAMAPKIYTRTGDDGTTGLLYGGRVGKDTPGPDAYGAVDEAVSALGLARAEAERGSRARRAADPPPARAVRGRRRARDRAREPRASSRRACRSSTAEMVDALEPLIDDITDALRRPDRVRAPRREPRRRRARPRPHGRAARRAPRGGRRARTAGSPTSQVVPYLNRLADLVYTLARWQEGTFRPVRTESTDPT